MNAAPRLSGARYIHDVSPISAERCIGGRDLTEPRLSPNGALLVYSKRDRPRAFIPRTDRVFVIANNDVHGTQAGMVQMPIHDLGIAPNASYVVEDLLDGGRYTWRGEWNFVRLDPHVRVAHIFVVR